MRYLLVVILMLGLVGAANAIGIGNIAPQKGDEPGGGSDGREGGENFGDAMVIAALPFNDSGATCDNIDNISPATCGFPGGAPDVVYSITPGSSAILTVSLCGSSYDTEIAIFNSAFAEIGCNDDFCGLQSQLDFSANAGETYYIVVDGYSANCGDYVISVISAGGPCDYTCPAGAVAENEPDCYDYYTDVTNGGCNSAPPIYQLICPQTTDGAVLCGESGTYTSSLGSTRDTDWFSVWGTGGTMTATVCASFPVQLLFIYGLDCNFPGYDAITGSAGQEVSLSRSVPAGVEAWIWVGPSVFTGVPCGSPYLLTMSGIATHEGCEPVPTETSSWGHIKSLFR